MPTITQNPDPRIQELLDLANETHLTLPMSPSAICALEDAGWIVNLSSGEITYEAGEQQRAVWLEPAGIGLPGQLPLLQGQP